MTALAAQRRRARGRGIGRGRSGDTGRTPSEAPPSLFDETPGEPTLDAIICGAWESLSAHGRATCPVCGGELVAAYGAHARPAEGRCGGCGTTLG